MTDPIASNRQAPEPRPSSVLSSTRRAGRWFLESGIQDSDGGVARYYRSDSRRNHRVSTEITGYAAAAFAYLHKLTGEPAYLEAARRTGRFLTRSGWDPALRTFPFEPVTGAEPSQALSYFFDCGIIVRGLLSLWRLTGEPETLEVAKACGDSMARDFKGNSEFHPVLSLPEKEPLPGDGRWSRNPGCYQLKAAMAWDELFEETGREEYRRDYEMVLGYSLRTHVAFPKGEPERERVMDRLHAYAYFLEGLLPCARQPVCGQALTEGVALLGRRLREIAPVFDRSDVYAQLLRLRLFAAGMGILPLDFRAAEEEASAIHAFQLAEPDPRIDGGFCFGRKEGKLLPYVNPASTAFCAQALEMWRQYRAGEFRADRLDLI
jgi:hypothetical protein